MSPLPDAPHDKIVATGESNHPLALEIPVPSVEEGDLVASIRTHRSPLTLIARVWTAFHLTGSCTVEPCPQAVMNGKPARHPHTICAKKHMFTSAHDLQHNAAEPPIRNAHHRDELVLFKLVLCICKG